jgi:F0F1-type ATP synthase assembly protein I
LIGLGATLVGFVVLGLVSGIALDSWMDSSPVCTMVGLFVGVLGALAVAIVEFRKFLR